MSNNGTAVATIAEARLPWHPGIEARFSDLGVNKTTWRPLVEAVFPAAKSADAVIMALAYCKARKLDPFKRPVAIVPMWDAKAKAYRETVWPSINELRTTAHRTGLYAGRDASKVGPTIERTFTGKVTAYEGGARKNFDKSVIVYFPEWIEVTVHRLIAGTRCPFTARVYWLETYGKLGGSDIPNDMWQRRALGQLDKCAEAAALRMAFPEEIGDYSAEEMEGQALRETPIGGPAVALDDIPSAPALAAEVVDDDLIADDGSDDQQPARAPQSDTLIAFEKALAAATTPTAMNGVWEMWEKKFAPAEQDAAADIFAARVSAAGQ